MGSPEFSNTLCFSYGEGVYLQGQHRYEGQIILGSHKLYLKSEQGEIAPTFIPLERIYKVRVWGGSVTFYVRPSNFMKFSAVIKGRPKDIQALVRDLADCRQLKKKFWGLEWIDVDEAV